MEVNSSSCYLQTPQADPEGLGRAASSTGRAITRRHGQSSILMVSLHFEAKSALLTQKIKMTITWYGGPIWQSHSTLVFTRKTRKVSRIFYSSWINGTLLILNNDWILHLCHWETRPLCIKFLLKYNTEKCEDHIYGIMIMKQHCPHSRSPYPLPGPSPHMHWDK